MEFWDNSLQIFKCLCQHGRQSVRRLAQQTGLSKSRVPRLTHALEHRDVHPESWVWETAEGRRWLRRRVIATLSTFGRTRGVGLDTIRAFFVRLRLETQVGCAPSALRGVMQALAAAGVETAQTWEQDGIAHGAVREVIGGVDETFLQRMMLVLQDWATGSLRGAEVADDRTFATWYAVVAARLTALGTTVFYVVSDRAQALIQLAAQGLACLSMPDCFHVVQEIVKSSALALAQRWRSAHQELTNAKAALARLQGSAQAAHATREAQALVEARQAAVTRWEAVHHTSRSHCETRSLTLPPFRMTDSPPQTSAQVDSQRTATVEAIVALAQRAQWPARPKGIPKIRKP